MMPPETSGDFVKEILDSLSSGRPDRGWKMFLDHYSDLIYSVARRYENSDFRAEDCYLHVCAKLSDDGFARLLSFSHDGKASFQTWITVVASNLCVDWCRTEYGRLRPFKVVQRLSEFEQAVFRHRFEYGMTLLECVHALQAQFPGLTEEQFSQANGRLNAALSSNEHWRLGARKRNVNVKEEARFETGSTEVGVDDLHPGPEEHAERGQDLDKLKKAIAQLTPKQQLIIQLRFQHGLTLEEVARLGRLGDLHQARRQLQRALEDLQVLLTD